MNARKLWAGRIFAMAESQWVDTYLWNQIGMDSDELVIGPSVGETKHIYLGAALDFPVDTAEKIRNAMKKMRQNKSLEKVLNKWR